MKASAFSYTRASSVVDALELLARHGDQAKVLSGGQSLMPALNLRLSAPELLVDIGAIAELRGVAVENGVLRIGALTRHVDVLRSAEIAKHAPLLTDAIAHVAHPAIRNRGTFGGSLAHADPASELPACVLALDAVLLVRSKNGERRIRAVEFFTGIYETLLSPEELLIAVEIPVAKPNAVHFFHEYSRRKGDYAIVGLAASAIRDGDVLENLRLGYFAVGDKPMLATASEHLTGRPVTASMLADAQTALDAELDPQEDQQASAGMRRYLARQLMARCVSTLLDRQDLATRALV
ncbi:FAD binding domain-containing protein [Afipia birgiae]|jgi:aerobic carbon-monoxide dehydrogenase medium subunit|uniref:FAD binding domain-containing protein n=1 Tax=Afipia birgiae TaxID=151414 RepID=UPI0002FF43EB|nr:xanthine dehydrogenase family protein subunit M [Afipia birgiae]MBX9819337.1 xanthine dehydrogenase family protein subunit M [Afipia birgiae]